MSRKAIRIHSEAQKEIDNAFERYFSAGRALAERFVDELHTSFKKIAANPELYPRCSRKTRSRLLAKFPYSVIYQEKETAILIVALAHGKRRPGYWVKRL